MCYDGGELVEISRWVGIGTPTAPHAVVNSRSGVANGGQHFVSGAKVVARRFFGICARIREDNAGVARLHEAGTLGEIWNEPSEERIGLFELRIYFGGTHEIVSANQADAQVSVLLNKAWKSRHQRSGWAVHCLE